MIRKMVGLSAVLWATLMAQSVAQSGSQADRSVTGAVLKGQYSTSRAMDLVYDDFNEETGCAAWTPRQSSNFNPSWPNTVRVHVLMDAAYDDSGVPHHLLVTWAKPPEGGAGEYSCHSCGVLLGAALFRKQAGGWVVEASDLQLAQLGTSGEPPKVKLQRLGSHIWGLVVQQSDMQHAQLQESLWIYGPKAGGFGEWFHTQLTEDQTLGLPEDNWCHERTSASDVMCVWRRIDFATDASGGKDVYDLVRTKRKPDAVKRDVWRFDGERFVKAPAEVASKGR